VEGRVKTFQSSKAERMYLWRTLFRDCEGAPSGRSQKFGSEGMESSRSAGK